MSQFLGLDASTQSLSAMVIDTATGELVVDETVSFGTELPQYNSPNGFLPADDPLVKHSDPLMWLDALDLLLQRCVDQGVDWSAVTGISGSGQQHGSVYLGAGFEGALAFDAGRSLAEQVKPHLTRATAPIWMDSSTAAECREIAAAVGGDDAMVRITGSRAIERFTGPQIRKFYKDAPDAYERTARIHLVSSFMASVLAGRDVGIDLGDGAGMNLLELAAGDWHEELLDATAPGLRDRLRPPVAPDQPVGVVAPYFVERYGFAAGTPVVPFSGDNPCSLAGMGATAPGTAVVSLGTSDTFFAAMSRPVTDPRGFGHVFGNPAGGFMSLVCFKNGSLAREAVRERIGNPGWDAVEKLVLEETAAGNGGNLMLPFFEAEITPRLLEPTVELRGDDAFCNWDEPAAAARAVIECQAVNMKVHADWIGEAPDRVRVTGGASQNRAIRQVLADVFQAEIQSLSVSNSAALGAALRAANGAGDHEWESLFGQFCKLDPEVTTPQPGNAEVYAEMAERFQALLAEVSA